MTATKAREATTAAPAVELPRLLRRGARNDRRRPDRTGERSTAVVAAELPRHEAMSGTDRLARRARVLEHLAAQFRDAAERAPGPRKAALRQAAREMQTEALRFTLAAAGAQATPGARRVQALTTT